MTTRVRVGRRVEDFLGTLAPEPRHALWRGIKGLAKGEGDIKQLEGKLASFSRLRVGRMRVIYDVQIVGGERQVLCLFAGHRATVYTLVEQLLASGLVEQLHRF
ncbi:MAG: mRNA interferase RelE/StbE [Verrucomicrobiota bacterium]